MAPESVSDSNIINNEKICRLCLGNDAKLNIFKEQPLFEKIRLCCTVEILKNDGLPENICAICLSTMETAVNFRNRCTENDKILRDMLLKKSKFKLKNEELAKVENVKSDLDDSGNGEDIEDEMTIKKPRVKRTRAPSVVAKNNESKEKKRRATRPRKKKDPELVKLQKELQPFLKKKGAKKNRRTGFSENGGLCPFCGKVFSIVSSYAIHIKKHSITELTFACELCPKKFREMRNLKDHTKTHLNIREYSCEVCGKLFGTKCDAKKHLERVHKKSKVVTCNICNKQLAHNNSLKCHMKIHTGERSFECDLCDKKFSFKGSLNIHMRCHTGEKPYACRFCDSKFAAIKTIKEHERLHTGETPYHCPVCDKGYTQRSNMMSHYRNNHKGIEFKPKPVKIENNPNPVCKFWGPRS